MATFADISIRFGADLKQFSSQMQNARRTLNKTGKQMQKIGAGLTIGVTAPLIALGAAAVKNFDLQAQAVAQVERGLISTGNAVGYNINQLKAHAAALQENSLFGDEQILEGVTAQLLTFTNIAGVQFERTQQAALDLSTRLGVDLKSSAIQLGKALNDPIANLSALSRSGIQFSKEQKATIKSLVETNKVAEAQTVILNELEKQYGGSAEAAAKAGLGPFKQLKNTIGDITEEFGEIIVDGLLPFVDKLKSITKSFQNLSPKTKKWIVILGGIAAAAGPLIALAGVVLPAIATGLTLLTGPIGLVIAALVGIGAVIAKYWEPIKETMAEIANYFIDLYNESVVFRVGVEAIRTTFQNLFAIGKFIFEALGTIIRNTAGRIADSFKPLGELFRAFLTGDLKKIPVIIGAGFSQGIDDAKDLFAGLTDDFENLKTEISKNISEGVDRGLNREGYKVENIDVQDIEDLVSGAVQKGLDKGITEGQKDLTPRLSKVDIPYKPLYADTGEAVPTADLVGQIAGPTEALDEFQVRLEEFNNDSAQVMNEIAINFASGFSDLVGGIVAGTASFGDVGAFLVETMGSIAQSLGKAILSIGISMKALKAAFSSPIGAIIAGGALIALGALLKATAKRFAGNFADGGLVPGSSFTGDKLTAGVNSGELILNIAQQKNLANALTASRTINLIPSLEYDGRNQRIMLTEVDEFNARVG
ncbi:MAG: hypothetical protein GY940_24230 [bacterium]|nr:hypothetical protein [bacterium]